MMIDDDYGDDHNGVRAGFKTRLVSDKSQSHECRYFGQATPRQESNHMED